MALRLRGESDSTRTRAVRPSPAVIKKVFTMKELVEVVGRSRAAIYSDIRRGVFPKAIATGPRSRRWMVREVEHWLEERAAERGQHPA